MKISKKIITVMICAILAFSTIYADNGCNTKVFAQDGISIEEAEITILDAGEFTYCGYAIEPSIAVTLDGEQLEENVDYVVSYTDNVNASVDYNTSYVEMVEYALALKNGTTTTAAATTEEITATDVSSDDSDEIVTTYATGSSSDEEDDDSGEDDEEYEEETLDPDDLIYNYTDVYPTITVTGIGDYCGTASVTFDIYPLDINSDEVTVDFSNIASSYAFEGKDKVPVAILTYNGETLNTFIDYIAIYENNFNAGTATVTIYGISNFTGQAATSFTIEKRDITDVTINYSFDSSGNLSISCNTGSYAMTNGTDYEYSYVTDSTGNITVTIKGIGTNYTGTATLAISASENPKAVSMTTTVQSTTPTVKQVTIKKAVSNSSRKMSIKWKKYKNVDGYVVRYSRKKKFKGTVYRKKVKKTKNTVTIKNLKAGKKYYVKVRAYRTVSGKKYYGKFSDVLSVKVKK